MHIADISIIGWIHTVGCIAALVAMSLSLLIYRFDIPLVRGARPGPHVFGLFHWFTVFALFFVLLGYFASSRQGRGLWAYTHPVAMTLSYYLLIGDLINELFARVNVLRPYAVDIIN